MYSISGTTIKMVRGDSFLATIEIYDAEGKAYEIKPGDSVTFVMAKPGEDAAVTKTVDTETMILELAPSDTDKLAAGRYVYKISLVSGTMKDTFISGSILLEA